MHIWTDNYLLMFKDARTVLIPISILIMVISVLLTMKDNLAYSRLLPDCSPTAENVIRVSWRHLMFRPKHKCDTSFTTNPQFAFVSLFSFQRLCAHSYYFSSVITLCEIILTLEILTLLWINSFIGSFNRDSPL